jgi:hypothetical protein
MPFILPWDADTGKNKKTYEEMLRITDDPTKIITLQLMELLPNVEKVLILPLKSNKLIWLIKMLLQ